MSHSSIPTAPAAENRDFNSYFLIIKREATFSIDEIPYMLSRSRNSDIVTRSKHRLLAAGRRWPYPPLLYELGTDRIRISFHTRFCESQVDGLCAKSLIDPRNLATDWESAIGFLESSVCDIPRSRGASADPGWRWC